MALRQCTGPQRMSKARRVAHGRSSTVGGDTTRKTLHLMRHGTTEMNTYLRDVMPYGSPGFKDPLFYDTRLTPQGIAGAKRAAAITKAIAPQPDLLVVSPLARALETAQLAWLPHYEGPVLVEPLARERVWLSSDVGSHPSKLAKEFNSGRFTFDCLPDIWWWHNDTQDPTHISLEPEDVFSQRVDEFKDWLLQRPESVIAIVAHWGLLSKLTRGADFENCELRTFTLYENGQVRQLYRNTAAATR